MRAISSPALIACLPPVAARSTCKLCGGAAISRPYIRAIGFWHATERLCGVGFLAPQGLKPERADRIYDSGVIAWWPSAQTEVAGVQLFLMRLGDHDIAIDPRLLLDLGSVPDRQAALWVEKLRMAAIPWDVALPAPDMLATGVTLDRGHNRVLSRFSRTEILPIDVVATEPLDNFWNRHATKLLSGAMAGLLLLGVWLYLVLLLSRHQLSFAVELQQAIARGEIRVRYQPVIELVSGRCVGAEALARWTRENGESVSPDVFIPVAEESGSIRDITLSVLRSAVRELKPILREFPHLSVNINLSRDDLKDDRLGSELTQLLASNGVAAKAIKLEITERALVNSDVSRDLIRGFRRRGHQVAVDDFGTGYSSLSYLQSFELDVLKIDKSFVDAIGTEAATSQVIVYVIEMANRSGWIWWQKGWRLPSKCIGCCSTTSRLVKAICTASRWARGISLNSCGTTSATSGTVPARTRADSRRVLRLPGLASLAITLAACATPDARKPAPAPPRSASPRPVTNAPAAPPQTPSIDPGNYQQDKERLRLSLARNRSQSLAPGEAGYYMDVLQGRLRQIGNSQFGLAHEGSRIVVTLIGTGADGARIDPSLPTQLVTLAKVLAEYRKTLVSVQAEGGGDEAKARHCTLQAIRRSVAAV